MTPEREELLHLLARLSDEAPQLRPGQLITNLATLARGPEVEAIWDVEDQELIASARRLLKQYQQRKAPEERAPGRGNLPMTK